MSQLTRGMFCEAFMGVLQAGQAERGVLKVKGSVGATAVADTAASPDASTSAAWERHSRSSMMGNR